MKNLISIVLLIVNSLLCNSIFYQLNKASALQEPINSEYIESDIVYRLNEEDKTVAVVEAKNLEAKEIIISERVNGYTVTKIENRAFGKPIHKNWTTIILPDSIIEIGERAFSACTQLETIKLPKHLKRIGAECFYFCSNLRVLNIPDSVDFIGEEALFSCISLEKVNIPKSLKTLEKGLFKHCISLNGIYIHENVEKIQEDIFAECGINLNLSKTAISEDNPYYEKRDNWIISKQDHSKLLNFEVFSEEYKEKIKFAKKLYRKMQKFLNEYKDCTIDNFDEECLKFLKKHSKPQKVLTMSEFEEKSKNKLILFRGVSKKEYANDFKAGKLFFADNLRNEHGSGIYTTPEYKHAQMWIWSPNSEDYKVLEQYAHDEKLYEKMAYKLVPHGEVLKMYLDNSAKILNNNYLREIKDLIFKLHPTYFKDAVTFRDGTFTDEIRKNLGIFTDKENILLHNSGLLTKLLDYDALYERETKAVIEDGKLGSEYLIVNPEVLSVLAA